MPAARLLLLFVKAPRPGRVKTRLAAELGDERAAQLYRRLGRRIVRQLLGGDFRIVIYYDPPDSEAEIRKWLGEGVGDFVAQPEGDLGDRLVHAFECGFEAGDLVCVAGSDIPGLEKAHVETAFSWLEDRGGPDAVFGPALDGGYYLLGLRRQAPRLFAGIPWSTEHVLERSLDRAESLGLDVRLLSPLMDIDRVEDLPPELREPVDDGDP